MQVRKDCFDCGNLLGYLMDAMLDGEWYEVSQYALDIEAHLQDDHHEETPDVGSDTGRRP